MTILEALDRVDSLKHNVCTREEKIEWLSRLDNLIVHEVLRTHAGGVQTPYVCYGPETPLDTVLLVSQPFDELYLHYLQAQIDYYNGETERYNQSMGMFRSVYRSFVDYYNRTHVPLGYGFVYF